MFKLPLGRIVKDLLDRRFGGIGISYIKVNIQSTAGVLKI